MELCGRVSFGQRALFALTAIGAASVSISLLAFSWNLPDLSFLLIYAFFVIAGGVLAAVPIVLIPSRFSARLPWAAVLVLGVILGPISLSLVFAVIFALQGRLRNYSLAHLGVGWPLSVIASLSALCVYVALVKRYSNKPGI